ncbi:MAG: response regulator transcription factor [Spirochaetaceae bacterium]|nr:response regulator transcription factor [Spirochaetaceae bacterium]
METILMVDDEPKILELVKSYLVLNRYAALCTTSGREGIKMFEEHNVSLILLDLMLPDFSGEEFCKKVRQMSEVPIIMLTARADESSIIRGLNIGADDYVTKPFSPKQLMARIQAVLRRNSGRGRTAPFLVYDDLVVDTGNRQASRNGEILSLTRDEYNTLALLMSRQTKIFTRDEILDAVKGGDYDGFDRSVDSTIKRLRSKIGDDPKTPKYIVTVYGMGYRFGIDK